MLGQITAARRRKAAEIALSFGAVATTLVFAFLSALLSGCAAKKDRAAVSRYTAVNEAYELLDDGQNSRAIALLEKVVRDEPTHAEARLMLSSAYMGLAGIDVLSMYDAFKDVLFSRSLSEIFLKGAGKPDDSTKKEIKQDPLTGAPARETLDGVEVTETERLLEKVDEFLNNVRRTLVILNRFPRVAERKWPLLDQALYQLDRTELQRDVRLYRMFIRIIYIKEVLITRLVRDDTFLSSRAWMCSIELNEAKESLVWLSSALTEISSDFIQVYPKEASPFARIEAVFSIVNQELAKIQDYASPGGETSTTTAQRRVRRLLGCGKERSS